MPAGPICYCSHCGALFAARFAQLPSSGSKLTFVFENCATPCPTCKKDADVLDGAFTFFEDGVKLIEGPQLTKELLKRFAEVTAAAKSGSISPSQLNAEADSLGPGFGKLTRQATSKGKVGLALLSAFAAALLSQCSTNINLDLNQLYDQVTRSDSKAKSDS